MKVIKTTTGIEFNAMPDKSIVDSAIASGFFFPYSCRQGRCKACKCKVVAGVANLLGDELGLTELEKEQGWILGCVRGAAGELTISAPSVLKFEMPQVKLVPCRISSLDLLSECVVKVTLRLPPNNRFNYFSGQYIDVIKGDLRRSYSIANAYSKDGELELHIKRFAEGQMSRYWFKEAKVNDLLRLNGPLGTFFLRDFVGKDLVFLGTGTGFAPIKAILESLSKVHDNEGPRSVRVYWGGRVLTDIYMNAPDTRFPYKLKKVLSRSEDGDAVGYVQVAALNDGIDIPNTQVFACGSNSMIEDARRLLLKAGLEEDNFHSDAFVCSSF